jgi:hypothetical protein
MNLLLSAFGDSVEFANPEYLMVLPIAGLILLFGCVVFGLRMALRPAWTHGSRYPFFGHIKFWFSLVLTLSLVSMAAARPFWVYGASSFKRGDVDVAVAIDGSASMWVKDLGSMSRLDVAIREVMNLYTQEILTPGDRVALFVFGTTAVRKAHLSSDAERFIDQVGRVSPPSTLTGDAFPWDSDIASAFEHIFSSIDNQDRFESGAEDWVPEQRSDRVVLLFTDGDFLGSRDQMARLDTALSELQRRGLTVYSVGIGSRTGTNLDDVLRSYVRGVDYDESLAADLDQIRTRLDTDGLGMLEQRTGGRSFVIESAGVSATPFLRSAVNSHRSISFQLVPAEDKQEIWQWVLAFAVVVFVLAVLLY